MYGTGQDGRGVVEVDPDGRGERGRRAGTDGKRESAGYKRGCGYPQSLWTGLCSITFRFASHARTLAIAGGTIVSLTFPSFLCHCL